MAQQALGPGTAVPRRRALFGLLDADGWAWASVKAFVWLIIIIFMLGYLPDRAYYLTVGRTVDLGVLVWSPINLCPPHEREPALPGAGRRARAVGAVAARAEPAAAADRRLGPPGRDPDLLHRRVGRDDRAVDGLRRGDGRLGQLRQVDRGSGPARAASRRQRRLHRRQHLCHRWTRRERRPDDDRVRAQPGFADGCPRRVVDRRLPGPARTAQRRRGGDHARTVCCWSAAATRRDRSRRR